MKPQTVQACMSQKVVSIEPNASVPDAQYLMNTHKIRRLPVVKEGSLVGIVTLHDIYQAEASDAISLKAWELQYILAKVKIQSIMTVKPVTVARDTPIRDTAKLMLRRKIGGLPVVDGDRVVGIVTESDLFRVMVEHWPGD